MIIQQLFIDNNGTSDTAACKLPVVTHVAIFYATLNLLQRTLSKLHESLGTQRASTEHNIGFGG